MLGLLKGGQVERILRHHKYSKIKQQHFSLPPPNFHYDHKYLVCFFFLRKSFFFVFLRFISLNILRFFFFHFYFPCSILSQKLATNRVGLNPSFIHNCSDENNFCLNSSLKFLKCLALSCLISQNPLGYVWHLIQYPFDL